MPRLQAEWLLRACLLLAALCWTLPAGAEDVPAADALWKEGKKLATEGKWEEACPKFEKSFELDEQLGTLLNLADCYGNLGKKATAWTRWNTALEWAKRVNDKRLTYIEEQQALAEKQVPWVEVQVVNAVDTLTIRREDVVVDKAMWGVKIPLDPGTHELEVLRGEVVLERIAVVATPARTEVVTIDLAAIDARHPPVVEPAPLPDPVPEPVVVTPPDKPQPYDPTQRNAGLIVGAVGLAAVLTAAGLEIAALVKKGQAEEPDACVNGFCSPEGLEDAESAATFAEAGQWVGIGGLVVLAVGATVFLTAPSPEDPPAAMLAPWVGPEGGGLAAGARF